MALSRTYLSHFKENHEIVTLDEIGKKKNICRLHKNSCQISDLILPNKIMLLL